MNTSFLDKPLVLDNEKATRTNKHSPLRIVRFWWRRYLLCIMMNTCLISSIAPFDQACSYPLEFYILSMDVWADNTLILVDIHRHVMAIVVANEPLVTWPPPRYVLLSPFPFHTHRFCLSPLYPTRLPASSPASVINFAESLLCCTGH